MRKVFGGAVKVERLICYKEYLDVLPLKLKELVVEDEWIGLSQGSVWGSPAS